MADIVTAIVALKADAIVNVSGNTTEAQLNGIVWKDGNPTNITNQQIVDKKAELDAAEAQETTDKATDKASGNQKLLDLGLSQAEVDALIG